MLSFSEVCLPKKEINVNATKIASVGFITRDKKEHSIRKQCEQGLQGRQENVFPFSKWATGQFEYSEWDHIFTVLECSKYLTP